jgi:hypothetical protein
MLLWYYYLYGFARFQANKIFLCLNPLKYKHSLEKSATSIQLHFSKNELHFSKLQLVYYPHFSLVIET